MKLENFDANRHDVNQVSELIYETDSEIFDALFGTKDAALDVFKSMIMHEADTYFNPPHLKMMMDEGTFIGIVASYEGHLQKTLGRETRQRMFKRLGLTSALKKFNITRKVARISRITMEDDALYILYLAVLPTYRHQGYGSRAVDLLQENYHTVYLHLNYKNNDARRFYESIGFEKSEEYYNCHKQTPIGYIILKRTSTDAIKQ